MCVCVYVCEVLMTDSERLQIKALLVNVGGWGGDVCILRPAGLMGGEEL